MAWRLFTLLFVVSTAAQATRHGSVSASLSCARTLAQRQNPTFFLLPLPFSDELLGDVLNNPIELDCTVAASEVLTSVDKDTQRTLSMAKQYRRLRPAEAEAVLHVPLAEDLTTFGQELRVLLAGRRFVDLGCGRPEISFVPRIVAEAMGAAAYVGVDIRNAPEVRADEFIRGQHFTSTFIQKDFAAYLTRQTVKAGDVFYLSGIEARDNRELEGRRYAQHVKRKLRQWMAEGDLVMIGDASPNFRTIPGFELILRGRTQRVFRRGP